MKQLFITAVLSLSLGACASTGSKQDSELSEELQAKREAAGYKCRYVAKTGSKFKKKVCSTRAQREYTAEQGKELIRSMNGAGNAQPAPSGPPR